MSRQTSPSTNLRRQSQPNRRERSNSPVPGQSNARSTDASNGTNDESRRWSTPSSSSAFGMQSSRTDFDEKDLKKELRSSQADKRKHALQQLIAEGSSGRDVSGLFSDVLQCVQSDSVELKKLVYLYLQKHAESNPEETILVVNMFVQDANDPNPVVRALAVRTMACVRVPKVAEYLVDPLLQALRDSEACVRQAAALAVPKLYALHPSLAAHSSFLPALQALLNDRSPSVLANAVVALREVQTRSGVSVLPKNIQEVIRILKESEAASGWQRVAILDTFATQVARSPSEAWLLIEGVVQDLNHSNSAVVLSTAKFLLVHIPVLNDPERQSLVLGKMRRPLLTLATTSKHNMEYVCIRILKLILQKYPELLQPEDQQAFFCRYNDPAYLKIEKIDLMLMLASPTNVEALLRELQEYAGEVDDDTARRAIRGIGICAVEIPSVSETCVDILVRLIDSGITHVLQESVSVLRGILCRYPGTFEHVLPTIANLIDSVEEPQARAAAVWMIGNASAEFSNAEALLERFLLNFQEEKTAVQLQVLTSTVKLYLKGNATISRETVENLLENVTKCSSNPDLRDRAFFYWRLLSQNDLSMASQVVLGQRPPTSGTAILQVEEPLLSELLGCIPNISSVCYKSPSSFVKVVDASAFESFASELSEPSRISASITPTSSSTATKPNVREDDMLKELYSLQLVEPPAAHATAKGDDPFSGIPSLVGSYMNPSTVGQDVSLLSGGPPGLEQSLPILLDHVRGKGMQVLGRLEGSKERGNQVVYHLRLENHTDFPMENFFIQLNQNSLGLRPENVRLDVQRLEAQHSTELWHPMVQERNVFAAAADENVQVALKTDQTGIVYFVDRLPSS